jgi:hypothetical protein
LVECNQGGSGVELKSEYRAENIPAAIRKTPSIKATNPKIRKSTLSKAAIHLKLVFQDFLSIPSLFASPHNL